MTQHPDDFEEFLRRALHAAGDPAEPSDDGLQRIRARLRTPYPVPVAWLMAACSWVATYARGSLDSVSAWLQRVPHPLARPGDAGERSRATDRQRQLDRLRLVFTVAAVTMLNNTTCSRAAYREFASGFNLTAQMMAWYWDVYRGGALTADADVEETAAGGALDARGDSENGFEIAAVKGKIDDAFPVYIIVDTGGIVD